jgi:TolA-binding protein
METANSPAVGSTKVAPAALGKNADQFTKSTYRFFDSLGKHQRALIGLLAVAILGMFVTVFFMGQKDKVSAEARSDLFIAQKKYETELKALAPPAPKPETKDAAKDAKEKKTPPPAPPVPLDDTEFKNFDVSAKLPGTVKAYQHVIEAYPDTRAAYDARMALGHLYLEHGQAAAAEGWFAQASTSSPRGLERALSFLALGYAREGQGKFKEAIESFTSSMSANEDATKGDALMGIARSYEGLHDSTNARATYEKIVSQLPNSEQARDAELYKAAVQ